MKKVRTTLSKLEKLELLSLCIEAATGVVGGSLVLTETHPYATLCVLAIGAISTKVIQYIQKKENAQRLDEAKAAPAEVAEVA